MPIAFALLVLAADPAPPLLRPATFTLDTCATATCAAPPPRSRYRLDREAEAADDGKATAMRHTTAPCDIGARVCTGRPRTLYRAGY
jgi:hypothetical protein